MSQIKSQKCELCHRVQFITDFRSGLVYCKCGLIQSSRILDQTVEHYDYKQDCSSFNLASNKRASLVYNFDREDGGLDLMPTKLDKRYQNQQNIKSSYTDEKLKRIQLKILNFCEVYSLCKKYEQQALSKLQMIKKAWIKCNSTYVAASIIWKVIEDNSVYITKKDFLNRKGLTFKRLRYTTQKLFSNSQAPIVIKSDKVYTNQQLQKYYRIIETFCRKTSQQSNRKLFKQTVEIIYKNYWLGGKSPKTITAAAIKAACQIYNINIKIEYIAAFCDVGKPAIENVFRELEPFIPKLTTYLNPETDSTGI